MYHLSHTVHIIVFKVPCALHAQKFENFWCLDCRLAAPIAFFQGLNSVANLRTCLHNLWLLLALLHSYLSHLVCMVVLWCKGWIGSGNELMAVHTQLRGCWILQTSVPTIIICFIRTISIKIISLLSCNVSSADYLSTSLPLYTCTHA